MNFQTTSETYIFIITGIILLNIFLGFIIYFMFLYRKRQKENKIERNDLILQYEKTLLQSQLEIQEQTFKNISMEIHDNIGQILSLAKLNLARMEAAAAPDLTPRITDTKNYVSKAIQDLRDLSRSLNSDYVQGIGLEKAIEYELEMIKKSGNYETQFITNHMLPFDKQKEIIIFRIVQELLQNIIKHAEAHCISVHLLADPEQLVLSVKDDGKGLNKDQQQPSLTGMGLRNLERRATMINGSFSLVNNPEGGTTATVTIKHYHQNQPHGNG